MGDFSRRAVMTAAGAAFGLALLDVTTRPTAASAATAPPTLPSLSGTTQDATAALAAWLAGAGSKPTLSGQYFIDSELVIPDNVRELKFTKDVQIKLRGDHHGLARRGTIKYREDLPGTVAAGVTSFTVGSPSKYVVGEYIMISGSASTAGPPENYGWLRKVTAISGSTVTVDKALPRPLQKIPRVSAVALSPSLRIWNDGQIFAVDPNVTTGALVHFYAVSNPQLDGPDLHHNGATAVLVSHCLGGKITTTIHDLLDDGVHFGYGVSVNGSTRGLFVGGTISRVRHAVTTNAGNYISKVGSAGEPEECRFEPIVIDCSDKSLDTHRVGWGNIFVPHVTGGLGGVQIRADNTIVLGGTIERSKGPGISVRSEVFVPPTVSDVVISNLEPSGIAVKASAAGKFRNITIRDCYGSSNYELASGSTVVGGSISAGCSVGVWFKGSNNSVTGIQLGASIKTPFIKDAGTANNVFQSVPPTDIEPLPAHYVTAPPTVTGAAGVGQTLTATAGTWNRTGLDFTFSWNRGGVPIPGAQERTYRTYVQTAADVGQPISVTVRAWRVGYADGFATSGQTVPATTGPSLTPTTFPVIQGTPSVGQRLETTRGVWSPKAQGMTFQWTLNGVPIDGATSAWLTMKEAFRGQQVTVVIVATRPGYADGTYTQPALLIS